MGTQYQSNSSWWWVRSTSEVNPLLFRQIALEGDRKLVTGTENGVVVESRKLPKSNRLQKSQRGFRAWAG